MAGQSLFVSAMFRTKSVSPTQPCEEFQLDWWVSSVHTFFFFYALKMPKAIFSAMPNYYSYHFEEVGKITGWGR